MGRRVLYPKIGISIIKQPTVDLIIEKQQYIDAYEIKLTKTLSREMADPLSYFCNEHNVRRAQVISLQEKQSLLMEGIDAVHWSAFHC